MRRFGSWFVLLCFASAAVAETPMWIWNSKNATDNQTVYARKEFELAGPVKTATLYATADNSITVSLNGKPVIQHRDWGSWGKANVTSLIRDDRALIAAVGKNEGGSAALLVKLEVEYKDGKKTTYVSDGTWSVATEASPGWDHADFAADWKQATVLGKLGMQPWGNVGKATIAAAPGEATPIENIQTLDGFKVERLYSVPLGQQGSWVSMTADPQGRLICSDQYGGLFRITPGADADTTKIEKLDVAIGDAQGLLCAFDALYVSVNGNAAQGSGFYRVTDTNGDDQYDKVELLKKFKGGGEHGPHAIRLGPDGMLYVIAGNHTDIPEGSEVGAPHKNWAEDLFLPRNPDGNGHATGRMAPAGWIARTDKDGEQWQLLCAGFRNPYDIAFNADGELFTYDADMEWDTGAPWYRPTRVNHAVSAAEFGWRYGTGKWPDYYVDSVGSVVDIGLGSPTGIEMGLGAKFPAKYQSALYINDWTYGVIYAVHMQPQGATYTATFEKFITGRPLPVTDICVNPKDGALYFAIGGRKTQSGLYRVTYDGNESTAPIATTEAKEGREARALRRELEMLHTTTADDALAKIWSSLGSNDRSIRYAARVALENQPIAAWKEKALAESNTNATIQALTALCRVGDKADQAAVLTKLNSLPYDRMSEEQTLDALRVYELAYIRLGGKQDDTINEAVVAQLNPRFPGDSEEVNHALFNVLVYLDAPGIVDRGMQQLFAGQTQQEQMFYAFALRNAASGWTMDQRKAYFSWMNLAQAKYRGGNSFKKFVMQIRNDAAEKLAKADLAELKEIMEGAQTEEVANLETTRQFVHNWQVDDLIAMLPEVESGRNFEKGRLVFEAAQCAKCHRYAGQGGGTGPDLTGVGNRFAPLYVLEAMIVPSKVVSDQYVNTIFQTDTGDILVGRIINETDDAYQIRSGPFAKELTTVKKDEVEGMKHSPQSEMPDGLMNTLTKEEILDLIAYLRSGGNPNDAAFSK
ncbi:c-type cytochrome [Blastopirellula sp. J2-11]|uniref:c-type cytochrome n=1 Tax=Blastopirellula sp. J2-11 TaxID=2943192 RepID=UPI0021C5AA9D|nr:c-type cytochrome [Blastopirellula sp. J2-11]UUO07696.1 c-type cytochrome [Blastopirellula sp. J2-11]